MTFRERLAFEQAADLPPDQREAFDDMLANGVKPVMALTLAVQKAPGGRGNHTPKFHNVGGRINDQAFVRNARRRMNDMGDKQRSQITAMAQRAGISTDGKFYCGRLGTYTDPLAWCSSAEDVLEAAKRKKLSVDGAVTYKAPVDETPVQGPALAPDIVKREVNKLLQKEPDTAAKLREGKVKKQELKERVIAKHGRKRMAFSGN